MEMIKAEYISKRYDDVQVLKDITFSINESEISVFKGRSGCGKSTLLNICSFLENKESGILNLFGTSVDTVDEKKKRDLLRNDIGYVFQDYNLFEDFSLYDNLKMYFLATGKWSSKESDELIKEKLSLVGLFEKADKKVKLLSGGERQRAAMARVLLTPKRIVFADEPSANIDDDNVEIMKSIFVDMKKKGTALMIVSHEDVFDDIADRIYVLSGGVLYEQ